MQTWKNVYAISQVKKKSRIQYLYSVYEMFIHENGNISQMERIVSLGKDLC